MPRDPQVQGPKREFTPEIDRLWDALTKRGMHYDRRSMEHDEPDLADRHRASLALTLDEGGWVPRAVADRLAEALAAALDLVELGESDWTSDHSTACNAAHDDLAEYRAAYPREETP